MNLKHDAQVPGDIANLFKTAASKKTVKPKKKAAPPFSLRLTSDERARLCEQAGNQSLGAYIRSRLLGNQSSKRRPIRRPGAV